MSTKKTELKSDIELVALCCQALEDIKGEKIVALDVRGKSSITNYIVIASAMAEPHLRAMKRELDKAFKERNVVILGADESKFSGWSVVDAFDVMIHLFDRDTRDVYKMEALWKDAERLDVEKLLAAK